MAQLSFQTLSFELKTDYLSVTLLNIFKTKILLAKLKTIGEFKLKDKHTLDFSDPNQKKIELKFSSLLSQALENLINTLNGNKTIYIHQNSGIPLIGSVEFGIVYRNTSLIEIKPITSCNLNCIYCSVGEGQSSKKIDLVVEKDYLVEELQKLLDFVAEPVEVHIGVQGEPFLYADLILLIKDLDKNPQIKTISMDTNFTLTTKSALDQISRFNKFRFNISLDAMDEKTAQLMAGCKYNLKMVLENIQYAVKKGIKILIAPLYLPGFNDSELEKIVEFVKKLQIKNPDNRPLIGIQNFLKYKTGRIPNKIQTKKWKEFYQIMKDLEKKTEMKLILKPEDFGIRKTKDLAKPFKEGDLVKAVIKSPDRFPRTVLAAAKDRVISIMDCDFRKEKSISVKILRDKHNIFSGKVV